MPRSPTMVSLLDPQIGGDFQLQIPGFLTSGKLLVRSTYTYLATEIDGKLKKDGCDINGGCNIAFISRLLTPTMTDNYSLILYVHVGKLIGPLCSGYDDEANDHLCGARDLIIHAISRLVNNGCFIIIKLSREETEKRT